MRKIVLALMIGSLGFASCNKEPQQLTKTEIKQKVDSITTARIKESDERAAKDLEVRIAIEVRVKADSIIAAKEKATKKDTTAKAAKKPVIKGPF